MNRRIVVIALAVLLAIVGTGSVYAYVKGADHRALAKTKSTTVLVAVKQVPAGTPASALQSGGYVKAERYPANAVPDNALSAIGDAVADQVATTDIPAGRLLLDQMLGSQAAPTTSGLVIPAGKMAVTVRLSAEADVAGYVQRSSQIAVFNTVKLLARPNTAAAKVINSVKDDDDATVLVIARAEVLAVSAAAPPTVPSHSSVSATSSSTTNLLVTLAVTQVQAARLINAAQVGKPYLALLTNDSVTKAGGIDDLGVLGSPVSNGTD